MDEEVKSKNNNSNMNSEELMQNNNNNINHDSKKLVLTIKVNDETETVSSSSSTNNGSENEKIIRVNGSTAIQIMTPPPVHPSMQNGSAISSIPINVPEVNGTSSEYLHGVSSSVNEEEEPEEEFDFSSSDFEDAQEDVGGSDHVTRIESSPNTSLTLPESDISMLQSPGPEVNKSVDLTPNIVDVEIDQEHDLSFSHQKSMDESEGRSEDDALISQFFGKANEIVGLITFFLLFIFVCLLKTGNKMVKVLFVIRILCLVSCDVTS